MRQAGRRNVMVAKRVKRRECDKNKKNDQKKTPEKIILVPAGLDLLASLKGPWACTLDHRCVPIRPIHTTFEHYPIHIGSSSNILLGKVSKNGYYNGYYGTTMVVPSPGGHKTIWVGYIWT